MLPLKLLFTKSPFQKCSTLFSLFSKEHQTTHSSTKGIIPLSLVTRVLLIFRQSTFFVNVLNAGRRPSLKYFHTLVFTSLVTDFGAGLHIMDQAFLTNSYFSHYELKKIYESSKIWRKLSKASRSDKWAAVFSKLRLA